jgi:hypothetical protein
MWKVQYTKDGKLIHEAEIDQPHAHDALMFGHHENANQADHIVMVKDDARPPLTAEEQRAADLAEAEASVKRLKGKESSADD